MPDYTFDTPEPVDLSVRVPSGTITVTAADTTTSTVEVTAIDEEARDLADEVTVRLDGRRLTVELPDRRIRIGLRRRRIAIRITVPTRSSLQGRTASATLRANGRYASAELHTASGELQIEHVDGDVEAHCASGDVSVGSGRAVTVHTASGQVRIGHATGDVEVHCASGRVRVGVAEASVRAKTASGDISIDEASAGTVSVNVASGDVRVGVRSGVTAKLDLRTVSGRIRSELPVDDTAPESGSPLEIQTRTTSGSVLVVPAQARPAS